MKTKKSKKPPRTALSYLIRFLHIIIYGDPGAGKSSFAATAPTPMLILCGDAYGKHTPYLRQFANHIAKRGHTPEGMDVLILKNPETMKVECQIEFYHNSKPRRGDAFPAFRRRTERLCDEEQGDWATVIVDSITSIEMRAREEAKYVTNPNSKEPRQWFAESTEQLESILIGGFSGFPAHIILIAHLTDARKSVEMHEEVYQTLSAPGRLRSGQGLPSQYSELYRAYVDSTGRHLQTESDGTYFCATQINAPNKCRPKWKSVLKNMEQN